MLVTITGQSIPTIIEADYVLTIGAGNGGSATGSAHTAVGAPGGNVQGLDLSLLEGNILISAGNGGIGSGGAGGNGGLVYAVKSVTYAGDLSVTAGDGGAAAGAIGNGGAGGSIYNLTDSLTLTNQLMELPYNVGLTAGFGGQSVSAIGGAGGSVANVNLTLQPSNESVTNEGAIPVTPHTNTDTTLRVAVTAGDGGNGATGGVGGSLKTIIPPLSSIKSSSSWARRRRTLPHSRRLIPVAATFTAGNGGNGSKATGGAGGGISGLNLVGLSHYDPDSNDPQAGQSPLVIISGNGGNGATTGGVGGAIIGVTSVNAEFTPNPGASTGSATACRHGSMSEPQCSSSRN